MAKRITVHISGQGARPDLVRMKDLAEVLSNIDESITAVARAVSPGIPDEILSLSLVGIDAGSINLAVVSPVPDLVTDAAQTIERALVRKSAVDPPPDAIKPLRSLRQACQRRTWSIDFLSDSDRVLTISPSIDLESSLPMPITGETSIYGRLVSVGGATRTTAHVVLVQGYTVVGQLSEDLARELGARLYTEIGLEGRATWSLPDYQIVDFEVTRILEYEPIPISKAFEVLRDAIGDAFDDVDPDAFVKQLRGN